MLREAIEQAAQPFSGDKCLVCGGKPDIVGIFVPKYPEEFGGQKNKFRMIRYVLCAKCKEAPDVNEKAEIILESMLAGGRTQ